MARVLDVLNAALRAVYDADSMGGAKASTGEPRYGGEEVDLDRGLPEGVVPGEVAWTADRGNWMWDGVLAVLEARGVDTEKPVAADAEF